MANPFMNNKKYHKIIINILIFVLFILPAVIALYLVLFKFDLTFKQFEALFGLFILGLAGLALNNMPEL
jgi:hypothetical protein